ncbi:MAG: helicase-related protein, partial [Planctomycetota bacterium]|nr:helicase-related protein [Planctomycetota bacterium]
MSRSIDGSSDEPKRSESTPRLPVLDVVPELAEVLRAGSSAVVTAPPGTGKSTAMPCGLLDRLRGRLFVTQPRRLAARMLASRSAGLRGTRIGEDVGYAVRGERRSSRSTRLLYLTEGLLLRRLLVGDGGPDPDDVVILDEFHERSIDADLLLGVLRDRGVRVVVASATLDAALVSESLEAPMLSVESRLHPVDVIHRKAPSGDPPWDLAAEALARLLEEAPDDEGDVLVFMPGRREIDRTIEACRRIGRGLDLRPLHGGLTAREQDLAVSPHGPRRVVVATNIAETSLTIPRVTTVVDSGLARVDRFDPGRDLAGLVTEPIDRASAEQRTGRAGRVGPGRCVRLYTESEFRRRTPERTPATARADLADAFLRLHAAGLDPRTFPWIQSPPPESVDHARRTLESIGAVSGGRPTAVGRRMAMLPIPPRVARFLL